MAYRFNNGRGGVTCDKCDILFDADLSFKEYEELYGKSEGREDRCWECKEKEKEEKKA